MTTPLRDKPWLIRTYAGHSTAAKSNELYRTNLGPACRSPSICRRRPATTAIIHGHSNGAEQIAVRARDCGMEVVYEGIRLTPERIVNAALEESVHVVGLSILSGGHVSLVADVLAGLRAAGIGDTPVIVGSIIPPADAELLLKSGVARVYTPKDFDLTQIMRDIVDVVDATAKEAA